MVAGARFACIERARLYAAELALARQTAIVRAMEAGTACVFGAAAALRRVIFTPFPFRNMRFPSALSGLICSADALLSALRGVPLRRPKQGLLYAVFRIVRRAARRRNTDVQIGIRVRFCREDSRPVFRKPTDSPPSCASRRRGAHCLFSAGRRSFAISSVLRAAS